MSRMPGILVLSVGLAIGSAQTRDQKKEQDVTHKSGAAASTDVGLNQETGCLSKDPRAFKLTPSNATTAIVLSGSSELLGKHVGHTVAVTGKRETKDGQEVLRVDSLKHIAASCGDDKEPSALSRPESPTSKEPKEGLTADEQGTSRSDQEITQRIRKSVVEDELLSMQAHNVKIITRSGQVTLRGLVRTEAEKKTVESKARAIAGDTRVTNELVVKPSDSQAKPQSN